MQKDPNQILKEAVDAVVHGINAEKLPPHAAVVKTAKEHRLSVHFIKRACEVVNVALTHEHFRKNAADRDADFPIVDAQKVASEVFAIEPAKGQAKLAHLSGTLVEEEVPNFNRVRNNPTFRSGSVKIAAEVSDPVVRKMSPMGVYEKSAAIVTQMERDVDTARTRLVGARRKVAECFTAITGWLKRDPAARSDFATIEKQSFARFGNEVVPYLDLTYSAADCKEARGEHDSKATMFTDCPELVKISDLLAAAQEMRQTTDTLAELSFDLADTRAKIAQAYRTAAKQEEAEVVDLAKEGSEGDEKKADEAIVVEDPVMAAVQKKIAEAAPAMTVCPIEAEKHLTPRQRATLPVVLQAKIIASKRAEEEGGEKVADAMSGLWNTFSDQYKHESSPSSPGPSSSTLDNLDRKLLVQNLMTTDPILKTNDPKHVADAYEQFLRIAPELSLEKEIVRSHLRQMSASQAMTAFDAAQLMDANQKMLNQRMVAGGAKPPKIDK